MSTHTACLIGGYASMARNFELHLAEWGIEVVQHIEYLPVRVPVKATLFIVLKSACCHPLSAAAQLVAEKRQIPLVVVDHHWTQAEHQLRQSGVLDAANVTPPHFDPALPYWAEARIAELVGEVTRLRKDLAQAEDLLLTQGATLESLQAQLRQQQGQIEMVAARPAHDPRQGMTLAELRRYATHELGIPRASKILGGKAALIHRIQAQIEG